jgi:hypothetical protein
MHDRPAISLHSNYDC